jgi:5'-methylthioadenosine phosphorylase
MRNIAIIGGTGIYNPEALSGFEEIVVNTPYGRVKANKGQIAGNSVTFITRHGLGHNCRRIK